MSVLVRPRRLLLPAAGLALLLLPACDDDGGRGSESPTVPERHENGAVRLDEHDLTAAIDSSGVHATLVIQRVGAGATGVASARLVSLDAATPGPFAEVRVAFDATQGPATVRLDLPGLPADVEATAQAAWTIDYRVEVADQPALFGARSLWTAVPKVEAQVLAPDTYDVGVRSGLRVIARDPATGRALPGAKVRVGFERADVEDGGAEWFEGTTDAEGQVAAPVEPAEGDAGAGTLVVEVDGDAAGQAAVRAPVLVGRSRRILLTTDKPLYQPSQTIHLRALVLGKGDRAAQAGQELVFEVEDAKGNKVFKDRRRTDDFGIASSDFRLAREVNMGRFTVRAQMDEDVVEKTVTVERYVLPRFSLGIELDRAWYRPGDTVRGTVRAIYTFGKPVSGGAVVVKAQTLDVELLTFAEVRGQTNEAGLYDFEVEVPAVLVGQDMAQGAAILNFEATVTDTADHQQIATKTATVATGEVRITVVPESGELVPGMDNLLFVQTTNPAGAPLAAHVTIEGEGWTRETDTGADGFGRLMVPVAGGTLAAMVTARTEAGDEASQELALQAGQVSGGLLLRTDRALYQVGDTLRIDVLAPVEADRLYVDVVRAARTVLTDVMVVASGAGALELDLGDDLTGSLTISVYMLTDASDVIRDSKVVYVDAADNLTVTVEADRDVYAPAETARLTLSVRNADGAGVPAALGLQVVDEAVFALTEMKPGLAETFFAIDELLTKPRVSVEAWDAHRAVAGDDPAEERDRAARMLFAGADVAGAPIDRNTHREAMTTLPALLRPLVLAHLKPFTDSMQRAAEIGLLTEENFDAWLASASESWVDPWGRLYAFDRPSYWEFVARSDGPDEVAGSVDDVTVDLGAAMGQGMRGGPGGGGEMDDDGFWAGADAEEGGMPPAPNAGPGEGEAEPGGHGGDKAEGEGPARIRRYFPETLLSEPSIITDSDGTKTIELTLADSITTWRASAMANTVAGEIGSTVGSVRVFQDFFIEPDLPATLTRTDEVSVPVAVFNYLDREQDVEVELIGTNGFEVLGDDTETLSLAPGEVAAVSFRLRAVDVGFGSVTVWGRGEALEDAVERTVEIVPNGKEFRTSQSGRLEGRVATACDIPEGTVPGSGRCFVKVYPGLVSQAVEGLDGMLRLPYG